MEDFNTKYDGEVDNINNFRYAQFMQSQKDMHLPS